MNWVVYKCWCFRVLTNTNSNSNIVRGMAHGYSSIVEVILLPSPFILSAVIRILRLLPVYYHHQQRITGTQTLYSNWSLIWFQFFIVWHLFGPKWDQISLVFPYIHSLQNHIFNFFGVFDEKKEEDVFTCMLGKIGSNMIHRNTLVVLKVYLLSVLSRRFTKWALSVFYSLPCLTEVFLMTWQIVILSKCSHEILYANLFLWPNSNPNREIFILIKLKPNAITRLTERPYFSKLKDNFFTMSTH